MLTTIQQRLEQLLAAHPWFDGVTILSEEHGDLVSQINKAIGKLAFYVLITTPAGRVDGSKDGKIHVRHQVELHLIETRITNKTGKRARDAVVPAIEAIQGQWCGMGNSRSTARQFGVTSYGLTPEDGATIYTVTAECSASLTSNNE